jgi:chromosome segregation ATPase
MRDQVEESDAELFQLQEELAKATSSQVETGALKKASSQSDRLQVELDHAIQQTVKLDAQVRSLTSTLESLNDDLEENQRLLQFADVEHGILAQAVSAANTAEQISTAQMNRLRKELEEAESALSEEREVTSTERQESQEMITRLRDDFAALQLEHEDLVDSKTQLETALETATSEIQRKENDLQSARDQLNSITANSTDGAVIELRRHVQELEARVARRNQLVAVEQAKTKKVEMNLEMATQDIEELEAEISRLREEVSAKEAVTNEKDAETAESREESLKQLDKLEQELVQSRGVEETLRLEVQARSDDLAKVVEQLARSDNDRQTEGLRATELREGLERDYLAKVDSVNREMQHQCERFEMELKSTWSDLQDATGTINSMTVQLILWSREIHSLESSRDGALRGAEVEASRNVDLRSRLETALAQVEAVSSQLSVKEDNLRQALQHAEVEASRNTSLRSEMEEAMAQAQAASNQVRVKETELQKALNGLTRDMEDSHAEASQQIGLLRERVKELEEQLRSTSTSLEQQADTASSAQEELVSVKAELIRLEDINATHTSERLQETETHTREVAAVREDCERLSHSLALATSDLEKVDDSYQATKKALKSLNRELDTSARQVEAITIERDNALETSATLQKEIAQLSTRCSDANAKEESATVRVAALENQLSQEMEQIDQLRAAQAQAETRLQQVLKQVDIQQSANEQLNRSLAEHSRDRFQIAAERDELIKDRQSADDQLAEEQSVAQQLRKDLESATNETTRLQAELQAK